MAAGMVREVVRYCQAESASRVMLCWLGRSGGALAVAAVVEGEDVDAEVVEAGEGGDGVGERAVAVGEKEDGEVGVAAAGVGGDPPAGELRGGGFVGAEADEFVGDAGDGVLELAAVRVGCRTSCHWP